MNLLDGPTRIIYLNRMPRFWKGKAELEAVAWFRDHVYYHHNAVLDADNISFTLECDPGRNAAIVNGVLQERMESLPSLSCAPYGTRIHTIATTRRNELLFRYRHGVLSPSAFPFAAHPLVFTPRFGGLLEHLCELLEETDVPGTADQIDLAALQLIAEVLAPRSGSGKRETPESRIRKAADRIIQHPEEDFNIETEAESIGVSRAAFYREWKKLYSVSPYRMLLENRIRVAKWYLRETSLSIRETALRAGFRSPEVFSSIFRKTCGVSPGVWRRGRD